MHVLVVGAGLAGLSAARKLAAEKHQITIIDARDRPGGRVWTVRDGFDDLQHGELGGEFIDETQKEICDLAKACGLRLIRVLYSGFSHRFVGSDGRFHLSRSGPWDLLEETLRPLVHRYQAAGRRPDAEPVRELATFSLGEWIRRRSDKPDLPAMAASLRGFFLADPDDLSVLPVVEQLASGGSPARARMYRIEGGADRLIDPAWRPLLSRRAGRLLFAGEHTSERWQGYMNGAVESGHKAARELLERPVPR